MRRRKAQGLVVPPVVMIEHEKLQLAPYNPNTMTASEREALRASLVKNGFVENLVVQKWSKKYKLALVLIGGHQRLGEFRAICVEEGIDPPLLPCVVLDIDDEQAMQLNIALNKIKGAPDPLKLGQIFAQVLPNMAEQDIIATGFSEHEIKALVRLTLPPSNEDNDDVVPEPPRVPVTKIGDVWELGDHVLVCGDSYVPEVRALGFRGRIADCVVTDPPYAIYGSSSGIGADIADDRMVRPFFEQLFRFIEPIVKPFGHIYVCCDWRSYSALTESSRAARTGGEYGVWPKNLIVWDKGGSGLGNNYANTYELVAYYAKLPTPKAMKSSTKERGQRQVLKSNIFRDDRPRGDDRQHNAAKSPKLIAFLIDNAADPGELVVDFFGGSGTTMIAAEQIGRRSVCFELEPRYCDVIIERWQRKTSGKAKRLAA
jgi:DNA modification methylase